MVIRLLILIFFVWLAPHAAFGTESGCLYCHVPHYEDLGNCNYCHHGIQKTKRKDIAHYGLIRGKYAFFRLPNLPVVEQGKQLLETFACRRCHISGQKGNALAADLDIRSKDLLPEEIFAAIKLPSSFMPDFHFADPQLVALVNQVLFNGTLTAKAEEDAPLVIHFDVKNNTDKDPFSKYCGGCHKMLTAQDGGLGKGEIGPNLSGLLTEFYPKTFKGNESWKSANLEKWLKNPRTIRENARMPPVLLQQSDFMTLLKILAPSKTTVSVSEEAPALLL